MILNGYLGMLIQTFYNYLFICTSINIFTLSSDVSILFISITLENVHQLDKNVLLMLTTQQIVST